MSKQNNNKLSGLECVYDQFEKCKLDLATAFWAFWLVGAFVASVILVYLTEFLHGIFWILILP